MSEQQSGEAIVQIKDVYKQYPLGKVTVDALRGVNMELYTGEFAALVGPSGSGKSTLLNMIGCVDVPSSGTVLIDGNDISKLKEKELTKLRLEKLGFIFQSFNLINVLSVYQNVEMPLLLQGRYSKAERDQRIKTIVDRVGLSKFITHRPNELSGGQRQRVSIARALITSPRIVLADEPTANLDSVTGKEIIDLMKEINEQEKTTFIFSTHDDRVVSRVERIIPIEDGLIKDTAEAAH
jgi:putative ABC transport system ATP-binding protein